MASKAQSKRLPLHVLHGTKRAETTTSIDDGIIDENEDSAFPEVRASVSNIDDPTLQILTFRSVFLSIFLCIIAGAINVYLQLRYPGPTLSPLLVMYVLLFNGSVLAYPLGKLMTLVLPMRVFRLPNILGGYQFSFNPCPFNIKEHALISMSATGTIIPSFLFNYVVAEDTIIPGPSNRTAWFDYLIIMSTSAIGFSFAVLVDRLLVQTPSMLWPQNLVVTTMLNTLHAEEDIHDHRMTRMKCLVLVTLAAFAYNFIPGVLFSALTYFCWLCWIKPHDVTLNIIAGNNGMGMLSFSFDWNQIVYHGSPLVMPWWAECNFFLGFLFFAWFIMPIMYFTNTYNSSYFPFSGSSRYDKYGGVYNAQRVIDMPSLKFDHAKYEAYSPIYLPLGFLVSYFGGFAVMTSMIVYVVTNHGSRVMRSWKLKKVEPDDIHAKLMRSYPKIPTWWFAAMFIISFIVIVTATDYLPFEFQSSTVVVSLLLSLLYLIPGGLIVAQTGLQIGNNILADVIGAYLLPSQPRAFMLFKGLAVQTLLSCMVFVSNLKIGHYMKISPRATFAIQVVVMLCVSSVQVAVKQILVDQFPDLCSLKQEYNMICLGVNTYYAASLVWSAIGPKYIFKNSAFQFMLWGLLAGAVAPVLQWLIQRRYRHSFINYINFPVIFFSISFLPLSGSLNYTMWFALGFIFQYYIRRRHFRWWSKYNFVTSNALELGTIVSQLVIFFTIQIPLINRAPVNWWGNTVVKTTADALYKPLLAPPPEGIPLQ